MKYYYFCFVCFFLPLHVSSYFVKVGILSHDLYPDTTKKIWSMAQNFTTMMSLEPIVEMIDSRHIDDAAKLARTVCSLVDRGVDALVYLGAPRWNSFLSSYSTHLGLPFIAAYSYEDVGEHQVCMLPDTSQAAADIIVHYDWSRFVFFYDSENGPNQLQKVFRLLMSANHIPRIDGFWKIDSVARALNYTNFLNSQEKEHFVLATSEEFANDFVRSASRCDVLLLTPVGTVLRPMYQRMNSLTKLSVVDAQDPILISLENRLKTLSTFVARGRSGKDVPDSTILHYDSSSTLDRMFNRMARENPSSLRPRMNRHCLQMADEVLGNGVFLKQTSIQHGASGSIKFDQEGRRVDYKLNIMQSTEHGYVQKIGTWSDRDGLQMLRETTRTSSSPKYESYKNDPPVKVTSIVIPPFLQKSDNGSLYGFVVDFLDELFKEIEMDYDLQLVKDGMYGVIKNGTMRGMIGELVRGEAQIAVAPLTKNLDRLKVIDFSPNIMTTGLNILMMKPESEKEIPTFTPFTFLTIWSPETWIAIVAATAVYSAAGYAISRFIGVPDRVRALETKGTDNLSPCGSAWFTVGSLFCRDTGIYPRNFTHRLLALMWWLFCIFIALQYVSMLTTELVRVRTSVTTTHSRKTSQELLKEYVETGFPVIGTIYGGSTMNLFMNSEIGIYQQYGRILQQKPEITTPSFKEGLERVRKSGGKYAIIMESSTSEFISNSAPCDTIATTGYLIPVSYGVALPKNSTLKDIIDHGVLSLMERGTLRALYEKWWHHQLSSCEDPQLNILPKVYNTSMTLHEVSGLFYLFIVFLVLSVAAATAEFYVKRRNIIVS